MFYSFKLSACSVYALILQVLIDTQTQPVLLNNTTQTLLVNKLAPNRVNCQYLYVQSMKSIVKTVCHVESALRQFICIESEYDNSKNLRINQIY